MQLYAGTLNDFITDATRHRIGERLKDAFFRHFRYSPSPTEVTSWQSSLHAMSMVLREASFNDHSIILEYQLPLSSRRLDCMVLGKDERDRSNAVIVELKQWEDVYRSNVADCVVTYVGGRLRDVLHPSRQVGQYQEYLEGCQAAFAPDGVRLASCGFLHNNLCDPSSELFNPRHAGILKRYPLFGRDQTDKLTTFLTDRLNAGQGEHVLTAVLKSKYRASKKLLDHTAAMIEGQKEYVLLDEQLVVFNAALAAARKALDGTGKAVMLIRGGPGTGKSILALNLVGTLCKSGYNAQHATGSRAFTGNIRKIVGSRAGIQFNYFNSYTDIERDGIDVLVLDEAHRIRETSNNRFTAPSGRSRLPQIEELVRAAKLSIFFIDDLQVVRPGETGSSQLIRQVAELYDATLEEFELDAQFRCNGSDAFINWVDNTLQTRQTANVMWDTKDEFEFKIIDSVRELEAMMRKKQNQGFTARLTAGFCWPWSDPTASGELVRDVKIGRWSMPWNAKPDSGRLARGIPRSQFWASDPKGIDQVGCIYTAQGFEYDYCGVIFGRDLRYEPKSGKWVGNKAASEDSVVKRSGERFVDLVKNTYRVLLTRGHKGCYVYFENDETRNFFRSRVE